MESITKQEIEVLIKLQDVEIETNRIRVVLSEIPKKLDLLNAKMQEFETFLDEKENTINELKKQYRENEANLQVHLDMITKSNEKLISVKTNKEYQAILKEIEELRKKNSKIEDQMLDCLDHTETEENSFSEKKEEYLELKAQIESEKDEIIQESEEEQKKMDIFEADWNSISAKIGPGLLERYKKIQEQSKGIAVAAAKGAVCQGCYMNIPPQMYNELQRCDTLQFCPHCQRIIYFNGNDEN